MVDVTRQLSNLIGLGLLTCGLLIMAACGWLVTQGPSYAVLGSALLVLVVPMWLMVAHELWHEYH